MNATFDFSGGLLGPAFSATPAVNITGSLEIDSTLRHKGAMVCRCHQAVGGQLWPLTAGVHHVDTVCTWSCCNDDWSTNKCRHLIAEKLRLEEEVKMKAMPKVSVNLFREVDVPMVAPAIKVESAGAPKIKIGLPEPRASFGTPAVKAPKPTFEVIEIPEVETTMQTAENEEFAPETGVACTLGMFQNPLWFIGGDFLNRPTLLTGKMDDAVFRKLIALNVITYLAMLSLDPNEKRNSEMIAAWLFAGCNTWIRVAGDNDIPTVPLTLNDSTNLYEFLSEFEQDEYGQCKYEEALRKEAINGRISEQKYLDWYVIARYSEAIIPPVMSGAPSFSLKHTCVIAAVLSMRPSLYDDFYLRKTPGGQTLDSFIQLGLDFPTCPVGLIAGDEYTYETFDEVVREVVNKMSLAKIPKLAILLPGADPIPPASWGHGGRSNLQAGDLINVSTVDRQKHVTSYLIGMTLKGMRNIRGFRFPAFCTRSERKSVEKILRAAITASNKGGKYATGDEIRTDMMAPSLEPWGGYFSTEWAQDRLHFTNTAETVQISVNHEDHMSVLVSGNGNAFSAKEVFEQYASTIKGVEKELNEYGYSFVRDNTYGYHTSFPQNMGTGLIATVEVLLPILMKKNPAPVFEKLGLNYPTPYKLSVGVCEITPMLRIGVSEVEQIQILITGIYALMAMEAALEKGDVAACAEMIKNLPNTFLAPSVQDPAGQFDNELPLGVTVWDDFNSDDFPLFSANHTSALSKVLTKELYKELSTPQKSVEAQGWSFNYAIRGGINCPDTPIGILLGGESSYEAYSPVLVPLIALLHSGFNCATMVQPAIDPNLRDLNYWINHSENVTSPYILSAVISASRNVYGFPMVPAADRKSKKIVNFVMKNAFTKRSKDLRGVYSSLNELSLYEMRNLETDNKSMLPPAPYPGTPRALVGGQKDGKEGCGYFRSDNGKIHAWVNDEDHLKLFVRDDGSKATIPAAVNLKSMIKEWAKTLVFIESVMEPSGFCFMRSERLGYVTSCPSNLGTAMRLTVTVNLAALRLTAAEAQVMGKDLNILMVPSTRSDATENIWDLTNTVVLGYTEVEIMENFFFGLTTIIELEMKATGLVAPLAGAVSVYGSLSDEELKYVKANEVVGNGVQKVTRTKTPEGSIDKYAGRVDITSKRALEGAWINKKLGSNMFQANRYVWIDHLTKSLHWAKTSDKLLPHKALSLVTVLKIGIAPKSTLGAMGASVSGKNRGKDGEARFDLPANSIRLQLSGSETHKDIHLPPGITVAEREDWITILSDCCGFKSRQSAVSGRATTDGLNILNTNPREFTFAPRSLSTPTKAPNNYGRKSLNLSRGLSGETEDSSPMNSKSPSRSMSPSELLFLAEQDNGGKPSNSVTLKVI